MLKIDEREETCYTKNPETFDESFSFNEPSSLSYLAMNSSISSFYCTLAALIRATARNFMIEVTRKRGRGKNFIHLPFDLSNGIEHVPFLNNRIRQSDGDFPHSIFSFTRSDFVGFDYRIRQNLTV